MSFLTSTLSPAQQAATQIVQIIKQSFNQLATSGRRGASLIWNNPNATPQDVVAALGTNAEVIFELANLNIATVTQAADIAGAPVPVIPSVPSNYEINFNPDGSGVVTAVESSQS